MAGLSFASVPLYRLFCQVTGFGGTPIISTQAPDRTADRMINVQFDARVDQGLAWAFQAPAHPVMLRVGDVGKATFWAKNTGTEPLTGTAAYNVSPEKMGPYFHKIQCFCFIEQVLQPGEEKEFPVTFFFDPDMIEDRGVDDVHVVTLSYIFYRKKE